MQFTDQRPNKLGNFLAFLLDREKESGRGLATENNSTFSKRSSRTDAAVLGKGMRNSALLLACLVITVSQILKKRKRLAVFAVLHK